MHGGQYGSNAYRKLLHDHEAEVLEGRERPVVADLADAQRSVAGYVDYYNHELLHASLDYQTPYHTPQQLLQLSALNCPA